MKSFFLRTVLAVAFVSTLAAQTPPPVATTNQVIEIKSDAFEYSQQTGVAIWNGSVRVTDPQMDLTCGVLTGKSAPLPVKDKDKEAKPGDTKPKSPGDALNVPLLGGKIESLVAERNVVIINRRDQSKASGEKAVFNAASDTVELTGNPSLETLQGRLWADLVILDRANNKLIGRGNIRMEIRSDLLIKTNKTGSVKSAPKK